MRSRRHRPRSAVSPPLVFVIDHHRWTYRVPGRDVRLTDVAGTSSVSRSPERAAPVL